MPTKPLQLPCRTCSEKFATSKMPDGGWRIAIDQMPPSATCEAHPGSALCRREVHKQRRELWEMVAPAFDGRPAAFLTMVPPRRLVAYDQVAAINLENEKRAVRRVLRNALPKGTVLVGMFDISLTDDQTGDTRVRYWVPHFHALVAGITAPDLKKTCRQLYKATKEVRRPIHIREATTPRGALDYSLKHIDDVYADTSFRQVVGSGIRGSRRRRLKAEEWKLLEGFTQQNPLGTYVFLMGFRCPGQIRNQARGFWAD